MIRVPRKLSLHTLHTLRLALGVAMLFVTTFARAFSITANVDKQVVTAGDSLTLSLSIEGGQIQQPSLPPIPGFTQGGGVNAGVVIVNNQIRQTFSFELVSSQPG